MLQIRTITKVADNSGVKFIRIFTILGGSRKRYATIGDIVVASVQSAEPRNRLGIKKKDKVKCVVVRQRHPIRRADGTVIRFDDNAVVLIDEKKEPKGTRVFGPLPREIREKGYETIFGLAEEIV